jgi:hypothetical protein
MHTIQISFFGCHNKNIITYFIFNIMKKLTIIFFTVFGAAALLSSCVKNREGWTDFSQIQPVLELKTGLSGGGGADLVNIAGLANFGNAALSSIPNYFADTISWNVNLASEYTLDRDITATIGVQPELLTTYNSDTTHLQYELMPDSDYVWQGDVTVTIPKGQRTELITGLQFNYDKIDPTKNYMLPIGIKSGDNILISGNQGAIYFHTIGNPNAGAYSEVGTRTNYNGSASGGSVASVSDLAGVKIASPESATVIDIDYANLAPSHYIITFNAAGTDVTDVVVDDDFVASVTGFTIDSYNYDAATKTLNVKSHYTNSSGNDRVIDETFTKQ